MTNNRLTRIEDFRDVETLGRYADETAAGITPEDFLAGANANGRDNARTPMQWDASDTAGFTAGTPWIKVNPNHVTINTEADRADPDGIFAYYKKLIALRQSCPVITAGRYRAFCRGRSLRIRLLSRNSRRASFRDCEFYRKTGEFRRTR